MSFTLFKDTIKEIRKSLGRFISIFAIVAIGVAFFAGIKATGTDMKYSADQYYDQNNLMDLTAISTFGLTDEDIQALREIEGIIGVMPSHSLDVVVSYGTSEIVTKIHGLPTNMSESNPDYINRPSLMSGKMPSKSGECVLEDWLFQAYGFKLGDTITISSGTKDPITDSLKTEHYTIVGTVESSYYLSPDSKGTSSNGRGSVDMYMLVLDSDFILEYYTEAYLTVSDALNLNSYKEEYFDLLSPVQSKVKLVGSERAEIRYDEVIAEATEKLDEAKAEYEEGKTLFETEIANAEKAIEDGKNELLSGSITLAVKKETTYASITSGEQQLAVLKGVIDELQVQYDSALEQYNTQNAEMIAQRDQLQLQLDQINTDNPTLDTDYTTSQNRLIELQTERVQIQLDTSLTEEERTTKLAEIDALITDEQTIFNLLQPIYTEKQNLTVQISAINQTLEFSESGLNQVKTQLDQLIVQYETQAAALVTAKETADVEFAKAEKEIEDGYKKLAAAEVTLATEKYKGELDLEDAYQEILKAELDIQSIGEPEWFILNRKQLYSYRDYENAANQIDAIGEIFPLFFFLVAALVCLTTMTRMVDEQRQIIGTLKALGYSRWAIAFKYIFYAFISSALGCIVGLAVGLVLFPSVIFHAWNIMYTVPKIYFESQVPLMILSSVIAIGVTLVATIFAVYKELFETPALLMRPKAPKSGKKILLERISFLWNRFSFTSKVTARNIFRYKKRFFMTVIGIAGCTALLIAGFGIKDSISSVVQKQFGEIFIYDASISLSEDMSTYDKELFLEELEEDSNITNYSLLSTSNGVVNENGEEFSVTIYVPTDVENFSNFVVLRNSGDKKPINLTDEGIIISQKMANKLGVSIGDSITVETGESYQASFEIIGIHENYVSDYVTMSASTYQDAFGIRPDNNLILLDMENTDLEARTAVTNNILENEDVKSIYFLAGSLESFQNMINSLNIVVYVLLISAGLLAFVVLYNLNNVNIGERIREIATIKVLGFYDGEVSEYINRESIILTIIGAIFGLLLGRLLHLFIMNVVEVEQIMFTRDVYLSSHIISFIITILFSVVVSFVMYWKLKKIPMVESLKSVE